MIYGNPELVGTLQMCLEFVGTFAFAISGIRLAASKHYDWFGGFVCGIAVAIGGGTIRDVMLGTTPFWMESAFYLLCTLVAQAVVILFHHSMKRLDNAWFLFDTLGLALFTIAGLQKTLAFGHPFWVAIAMGVMTGSAGGVIRDVLLNVASHFPQGDLRYGQRAGRFGVLGFMGFTREQCHLCGGGFRYGLRGEIFGGSLPYFLTQIT